MFVSPTRFSSYVTVVSVPACSTFRPEVWKDSARLKTPRADENWGGEGVGGAGAGLGFNWLRGTSDSRRFSLRHSGDRARSPEPFHVSRNASLPYLRCFEYIA